MICPLPRHASKRDAVGSRPDAGQRLREGARIGKHILREDARPAGIWGSTVRFGHGVVVPIRGSRFVPCLIVRSVLTAVVRWPSGQQG